ncbi:MAG: PAS domain-containing sensor histidine kinase [Pseudomonadota bacterium]
MKRKIFPRITLKLALWLVGLSSLLTFVGTAAQLYMDCREDSQAVAAGEGGSGGLVIEQLSHVTGCAYANVVTAEEGQNQPKRRSPGAFERRFDGKLTECGFNSRFMHILLANGIKIFSMAGCAFFLFHFFVVRHLQSLARQVAHLDFTNPDSVLTCRRYNQKEKNELDEIVSGFNTTLARARQAYNTLVGNEQRLLLFFDSTEEAIVGVGLDGICSFANDACLQLLAQKEYEEIIGKELSSLFSHSDLKKNSEFGNQGLIRQTMAKGLALQCEDGCITLPCGKTLFVALRVYPVFKEGEVSGALLFMNDTGEKRQLRRERRLLGEAIEQVPVMILIADCEHRIQYANRGAESLTGFSRKELVDRSIFLVEWRSAEGDRAPISAQNCLQNGQQWEGILETRSKWGKPLKFFSVISPVFDDRNAVVNLISVSREVSCEIALQNELINTKKMEAVGRLSVSFAHEFGNPLFGVRSVLRDICDRVAFSDDDKYLLELAHGECERMRSMVREFQHLDRQTEAREEHIEITKVIGDVLEDVRPFLTAHRIEPFTEFSDNTRGIVGNKSKLSLVVRNIVNNAVENMVKSGGDLRISTVLDGDFLLISVGDSGGGIKKEHQDLIFEPFFSTKPEVEGKGLGLSVAYGAMKGLGGTITFVSEEGKGSVFTLHVPIDQSAFLRLSAIK